MRLPPLLLITGILGSGLLAAGPAEAPSVPSTDKTELERTVPLGSVPVGRVAEIRVSVEDLLALGGVKEQAGSGWQVLGPDGKRLEHQLLFPETALGVHAGAEAVLWVRLPEPVEQAETIRLRLIPGKPVRAPLDAPVLVEDSWDEDQPAFRIVTPAATYFFQKEGASLSTLLDRDGNDWIGYQPGDGPRGAFRGVPNAGHPDPIQHPGGRLSRSWVEASGPLVVRIRTESKDGSWAAHWDFFPDYARMTMLRTPVPYWFLYEGTPGGQADAEEDRWLRADGTSGRLRDAWRGVSMPADWTAFLDARLERSLLVHHNVNQSADSSYWLMQQAMTVYAFGRRTRQEKSLTETPRIFHLIPLETRSEAEIQRVAARLPNLPFSAPQPVSESASP